MGKFILKNLTITIHGVVGIADRQENRRRLFRGIERNTEKAAFHMEVLMKYPELYRWSKNGEVRFYWRKAYKKARHKRSAKRIDYTLLIG